MMQTRESAEVDINFASQQGLPFFLAHGTMLRGWALAADGEDAAGIADLEEGLAIHEKTGVVATRPYWLSLLAWAQRAVAVVSGSGWACWTKRLPSCSTNICGMRSLIAKEGSYCCLRTPPRSRRIASMMRKRKFVSFARSNSPSNGRSPSNFALL
jgi:hypothetical protein